MKYLITGGAGFIGSHLAEKLVSLNHDVIVLDDLSTGSYSNIIRLVESNRFSFVHGSVTETELVSELVESCDGIFHLAAAVGVKKILDDPLGSLKTNLEGTESILLSATRHQKRVLIASTSEIYGKNDAEPLTEESNRILGSPLTIRWTYSEAKAIDEALARVLYERKGLRVQIIRFFNTVGPRQSPSYGMAIPSFFQAAVNDEPLSIYGDGMQRRVFCHIRDAIDGTLALWNTNSGYGEAFNLGGFEETTILDLAKRILSLTKSQSTLRFISYEELAKTGFEDMKRRIPVTKKIENFTGWRAIRNLDSILTDTFLTQFKRG